MSPRGYKRIATIVLAWCILSFPQPVHAYVDPGTGSYLLQVLIAGIAAASLSLKLFWGRIRLLFSRSRKETSPPDQDDATENR